MNDNQSWFYRPLLTSLLCLFLPLASIHAEDRKPNIILIYSDDHGYADLGALGVDKDIVTPHIDQLARDGINFPRGYVSAPQCVPSRAGVITGRYQQRFGVEDNQQGPLPLAELTIAERLKPAGYISCQVGKWHLEKGGRQGAREDKQINDSATPSFLPLNQGFDEYYTGPMNSFIASHDLQGNKLANAPQTLRDKRFRCEWQTDAALSFVERHADEPFFLYLAYYTPHVPLESPEPWFSQTSEHLPLERRQALAMIAAMDDGIGRLREKLRDVGIEQNTLIFFISDNGAPLTRGAWNGSLNLPLTGEKGMLTDGGVRTPFVAAWPGTLPAGQTYEHPVSALDVASTSVALAGLPHDENLDGVNLMPFLTGENKAAPHDYLFWRWRSQAAVLEFPWKLIRLGADERYLFDTTTFDGETKNLITQHPEIAARLQQKLQTWSEGLTPPGLPSVVVAQDANFYSTHFSQDPVEPAASSGKREKTDTTRNDTTRNDSASNDTAALQGWLARNASIEVREGALGFTPDANSRANVPIFLSRNRLDLAGPVTATLSIRATQGGASSFTWRTKDQSDFALENSVTFNWPTSAEWQEVKVTLPVQGRLVHLRLTPPKGASDIAIQSMELQPSDGKTQSFRFNSK
jgi:arylsulfatase A-like enzyme